MAPSHIPQIFLRVSVQDQIRIAQRVIVNKIVQLRSLRHGHIQCILIISHQERILNIADTIVLLKDGRLAECGPREEVLPRLLRNIDTAPPVCSMLSDPIKEVR